MIVGVISDTHGLLRPEAVAALRGVELILHAGDIGAAAVLDHLRALAPVVAVRGNNDREAWAASLPEVVVDTIAGTRVCLIHDLKALRVDADTERLDVIVSGHSHRPGLEQKGRVLLVNPGSAGPRRFSLPITVARLHLGGATPRAEIVELDVGAAAPRRQRSAAFRSR